MIGIGVFIGYGLFYILIDILNKIKKGIKGDVFELGFILMIVVFVIFDKVWDGVLKKVYVMV